MTPRKKRWLIGFAAATGLLLVALFVAGREMAKRFEPYIREEAVKYLRDRFDSEVQVGSLRIGMPHLSPLRVLFNKGHGAVARVEGEEILLRHKGRVGSAPICVMKRFAFEVDLGTVFDSPKRVQLVTIDGMEINIPPKGERPEFGVNEEQDDNSPSTDVIFDEVRINDSMLSILPRDRAKTPLRF